MSLSRAAIGTRDDASVFPCRTLFATLRGLAAIGVLASFRPFSIFRPHRNSTEFVSVAVLQARYFNRSLAASVFSSFFTHSEFALYFVVVLLFPLEKLLTRCLTGNGLFFIQVLHTEGMGGINWQSFCGGEIWVSACLAFIFISQ